MSGSEVCDEIIGRMQHDESTNHRSRRVTVASSKDCSLENFDFNGAKGPTLSVATSCHLRKVLCSVCGTRNRLRKGDQMPCQICGEEIHIQEIADSASQDTTSVSSLSFEKGGDVTECPESFDFSDDLNSSSLSLCSLYSGHSSCLSDDTPWLAQWQAEDTCSAPSEPASIFAKPMRGGYVHQNHGPNCGRRQTVET